MEVARRVFGIRVDGSYWSLALLSLLLLGFAIQYFAGGAGGEVLRAAAFLALASLVIGALLGFLFGIPRSLQDGDPAPSARSSGASVRLRYGSNTNLEQISDWLTKILVGVGLTQLTHVPELLDRLGAYFGPAISATHGGSIAISMSVFFCVVGFLFSYVWTRLYMAAELARADASIEDQQRAIRQFVDRQAETDAAALRMTQDYLASDNPIDELVLSEQIRQASAPVRMQIFQQARALRKSAQANMQDRQRLPRVVTVFKALVEAEKANPNHQTLGQLAFALKEKNPPEYQPAFDALSEAIRLRGDVAENGFSIYELNRAIARVNLDADFQAGRVSLDAVKQAILRDLEIGVQSDTDLPDQSAVVRWLRINEPNSPHLDKVKPSA